MPKKVLFVEDDEGFFNIFSVPLKMKGYNVAHVAEGSRAMDFILQEKPDLVLLDIILPKKDGFKVLEEIKQDETTKNIPVILLTNLESIDDIQKAFDKGATTYLVKSEYKLEDVVKKINETLK